MTMTMWTTMWMRVLLVFVLIPFVAWADDLDTRVVDGKLLCAFHYGVQFLGRVDLQAEVVCRRARQRVRRRVQISAR